MERRKTNMRSLSTYITEASKRDLLWVDDLRDPKESRWAEWIRKNTEINPSVDNITWVTDYKQFCDYIDQNGLPDWVCFDHDLGEEGDDEKNGYSCAKYLVDYCQEHDLDIPDFEIQSSNPVGAENINSIMNNWSKVWHRKHN